MREGEWRVVKGRRQGKHERFTERVVSDRGHRGAPTKKGFVDYIRESTISFFFTNFPEDANRNDLWRAFNEAGEVADVFIPSKVDKWGKRFGFVRFKEVRDFARLERKMENVWIGSFKLQINRPHAANGPSVALNKVKIKVDRGKDVLVEKGEDLGSSSKARVDEVMGVPRWGEWPSLLPTKKSTPWGQAKSTNTFNIEFEVDEDRVKSLSTCFVGVLAESKSATAQEFEHSLQLEGYHAIKVTPMGADSVLLSSKVEGAIPDAIASNRGWWSAWLRGFSAWNPNLISRKRRVWVRALGVPLHVWENCFFNSLALRFEQCEEIDLETSEGYRYDVGRFQILTSWPGLIDHIVKVFARGDVFPVTVLEERFGDVDRGVSIPPQKLVMGYSSGSDECSSSIGLSLGSLEEAMEEHGGDEDGWVMSDGRCGCPCTAVSNQIAPLVNLISKEQTEEKRDKVFTELGISVFWEARVSGVGGDERDASSVNGETSMVMGEGKSSRLMVACQEEGNRGVRFTREEATRLGEEESEFMVSKGDIANVVGRVEGVGQQRAIGSGIKLLFRAHGDNNDDSNTEGVENNSNWNLGLNGFSDMAQFQIVGGSFIHGQLGVEIQPNSDPISLQDQAEFSKSQPLLHDSSSTFLQRNARGRGSRRRRGWLVVVGAVGEEVVMVRLCFPLLGGF